MNFENQANSEPPIAGQETRESSLFKKYSDKAKRLARILFVGGSLGLAAIGGSEYIDKTEAYGVHVETESLEDRNRYESLRQMIVGKFGEETAERIEAADKTAYLRRAELAKNEVPIPEGFGKEGLNDAELKELWSPKHYPESWLKNVVSIDYKSGNRAMSSRYGRAMEKDSAEAVTESNLGSSHIKIFELKEGKNFTPQEKVDFFDMYFGHELGHSNDWETNPAFSRKERAELLMSVGVRMSSEDHFRTIMDKFVGAKSYHDAIENADKHAENYLKAKEYFGTLCEGYFGTPDLMAVDNPKDFKIVDDLVKKTDVNFNPIKAEADKTAFIHSHFSSEAVPNEAK